MGTTTYHLIGYTLVTVMWIVALFGIWQVVQSLRPYLAPHASAIFNAIREDWADHRRERAAMRESRILRELAATKKHAPQMAKRVDRLDGRRDQGNGLRLAYPAYGRAYPGELRTA